MARHRHELFHDEDFADLYHAELGPPEHAAERALLRTVAYDKCSDAEARERAAHDQRWKALGLTDLAKPFTKSTLQLFRVQLLLMRRGGCRSSGAIGQNRQRPIGLKPAT